jgi:hypothetical protein
VEFYCTYTDVHHVVGKSEEKRPRGRCVLGSHVVECACEICIVCGCLFVNVRLSGTADSNKQGSVKSYAIHSMHYNE